MQETCPIVALQLFFLLWPLDNSWATQGFQSFMYAYVALYLLICEQL